MSNWTHIVTCKEAEQAYCRGYEIKAAVDASGKWRCVERELNPPLDFGKTLTNVKVLKTRRA